MDPGTWFLIAVVLIMLLLGGLRHARLRDTDSQGWEERDIPRDSDGLPARGAHWDEDDWSLDDQYTREDRSQRARAERRLERDLGL